MSLISLNVFLADAAATGATQPNPKAGTAMLVCYVVIIFAVFYFMTIRPQSQKAKQHAALLGSIKPGDKVVTSSGVVGIVVSVKEKTVAIRSVETKLEFLKSAIAEITERAGETAANEA